ncbi:MAG: cytochrome c3 family protein [Acidobacteriia bacterium]|nr:cytochrome c3 family protein [Terriglobia bacterium]
MKCSNVLVVLATFVITSAAWAQTSKVIGSKHDINSQGCKGCHASHDGASATGGSNAASGKILLWDRDFSTQTFGVYDSPSMQNKAAEIGGATPLQNTDARMNSLLCMSCHDGVTTPNLTANTGPTGSVSVGNPANSFGLQNDHPVNMSHDPTKNAQLTPVATVTGGGLTLYGSANTVQCSSCHTTHDPTNGSFLRKANTNSALCTTCHL